MTELPVKGSMRVLDAILNGADTCRDVADETGICGHKVSSYLSQLHKDCLVRKAGWFWKRAAGGRMHKCIRWEPCRQTRAGAQSAIMEGVE